MGAYWKTNYWPGGAAGYWTAGYWYGPSALVSPNEFDSIYWRILKSVRDALKTGDFLSGADEARVHLVTIADFRDPVVDGVTTQLKLPAVYVYPAGMSDTDRGTNTRDDWSYSVGVALVIRGNQSQTDHLSRKLQWMEKIRRRFCRSRLGIDDDSGCQYTCTMERATVVDQIKFYREGYDVALVQLRFMTRESRDYD